MQKTACRIRLPNLLTYNFYSRAVKGSTAENPEFVIEFLNMLNHDLQNYVKNDFDLMQNIKATNSNRVLTYSYCLTLLPLLSRKAKIPKN